MFLSLGSVYGWWRVEAHIALQTLPFLWMAVATRVDDVLGCKQYSRTRLERVQQKKHCH